MKYGSLQNMMLAGVTAPQAIEIGVPATLLYYTDRTPATVVDVYQRGKFTYVVCQEGYSKRIDNNGMSEAQEYEYSRNPNGNKTQYRLNAKGKLVSGYFDQHTKRWNTLTGVAVIGVRERYYDFSF